MVCLVTVYVIATLASQETTASLAAQVSRPAQTTVCVTPFNLVVPAIPDMAATRAKYNAPNPMQEYFALDTVSAAMVQRAMVRVNAISDILA